MFTGIVTAIGRISRIDHNKGGDARFYIDTPWDCQSIALGASIACSGCCLTLVEAEGQGFAVDVSLETIAVTTLNTWEVGTEINLERALSMGDELGGHIVSGHVDGLGEIIDITRDGDGHRVVIDAPADLAHLIAPKGSVTLEGISLTVNEVDGRRFGIMVIPHTWDN
ncbi:MAG: riboflavin synthase, partial [SAR116 cluster bacterium MED-G04]